MDQLFKTTLIKITTKITTKKEVKRLRKGHPQPLDDAHLHPGNTGRDSALEVAHLHGPP